MFHSGPRQADRLVLSPNKLLTKDNTVFDKLKL